MLWRLPNKDVKSYIGKTRNDQGLKLSDNVKLVLIFWAINLKLKILIQVGVNGTNYITGHHSKIMDKIADFRVLNEMVNSDLNCRNGLIDPKSIH